MSQLATGVEGSAGGEQLAGRMVEVEVDQRPLLSVFLALLFSVAPDHLSQGKIGAAHQNEEVAGDESALAPVIVAAYDDVGFFLPAIGTMLDEGRLLGLIVGDVLPSVLGRASTSLLSGFLYVSLVTLIK